MTAKPAGGSLPARSQIWGPWNRNLPTVLLYVEYMFFFFLALALITIDAVSFHNSSINFGGKSWWSVLGTLVGYGSQDKEWHLTKSSCDDNNLLGSLFATTVSNFGSTNKLCYPTAKLLYHHPDVEHHWNVPKNRLDHYFQNICQLTVPT